MRSVVVDNHLWRLAWALPLVLVIGVTFILALKRWGVTRLPGWLPAVAPDQPPRTGRVDNASDDLRVVSDLLVSEDTRVYLIEVGDQRWLLTESRMNASTQLLTPQRTP